MAETKTSSWLKPSLDWLLIFVPVVIALQFIPGLDYPTAFFIVACLAILFYFLPDMHHAATDAINGAAY
ncbi:MAG: hypothetical protein ACR2J3_01840 [Aridibacter sp.]